MTGPAGRPARGRRDNGLDASAFVALLDLDPRVGEHLLDVLALAGIAAYLQPSADFNPIVRSTTLPSRPIDRLWVDREYADDARALLDGAELDDSPRGVGEPGWSRGDAAGGTGPAGGPEAATDSRDDPDLDVETAWAQIIADYDAPAGSTVPTWPTIEDTDRGEPADRDGRDTVSFRVDDLRPAGPPEPGPRDSVPAEPGDDDLDPDDEGYTPPPPPPFPRPSVQAVLAVVAIVVGFLLFFRPNLLGIDQDASLVLGVMGILGGAAALVYRLRDLGPDDDPDDGAVV